MQIKQRSINDVLVLRIEGRLEASTLARLKSLLAETPDTAKFVFDMAYTDFIDSMGMASLVSALKLARSRGGELILVNPSVEVRTILELTAMDRVFTIAPNIQAALEMIGGSGG
jgi:anti-sigma B factor antagonist